MSARPWDQGLSRKHILDASGLVRRLRTDYVDLYQLHHPTRSRRSTRACRHSTTWSAPARRATSAARISSRIRSRARSGEVSCSPGAPGLGAAPLTTSSTGRSSASCSRCAPRKKIGVIAYNPIAGGLLSGKHRREAGPMPGTRFTHPTAGAATASVLARQELATVEALRPLRRRGGMSMVQMAVAWVLENRSSPRRSSAPAARAARRRAGAVDKRLAHDLKARLDTSRGNTAGATDIRWRRRAHHGRVCDSRRYQGVARRMADWPSLPAGHRRGGLADHLSGTDAGGQATRRTSTRWWPCASGRRSRGRFSSGCRAQAPGDDGHAQRVH